MAQDLTDDQRAIEAEARLQEDPVLALETVLRLTKDYAVQAEPIEGTGGCFFVTVAGVRIGALTPTSYGDGQLDFTGMGPLEGRKRSGRWDSVQWQVRMELDSWMHLRHYALEKERLTGR